MPEKYTIEKFNETHSITEITNLLHRSYKFLQDMGLNYFATHQSESVTLNRLSKGESFIMLNKQQIIGTITLKSSHQTMGSPWYNTVGVGCLTQFAIDPSLQKQGLGLKLMSLAEGRAKELRLSHLALDTAEAAHHLIAMYQKRGYEFVEHVQWESVDYRSIIMSKKI